MADEKEFPAQIDSIKKDIEKLTAAGNVAKALEAALTMPVPKDEKLKLSGTNAVCGVLAAVKEADIPKLIDGMSPDDRGTAMKYVYRGMATGQNCTQLLKWHSALYDKDGAGSIMRVLVDKNL